MKYSLLLGFLAMALSGCDVTGSHARCEELLASDSPPKKSGKESLAEANSAAAHSITLTREVVSGVFGTERQSKEVSYAYLVKLTPEGRATFQFALAAPGITFKPITKEGQYTLRGDRVVCDFGVDAMDMMSHLAVGPTMEPQAAMRFAEVTRALVPCEQGETLWFRWNGVTRSLALNSVELAPVGAND
jgi:hypothetical protein